MIGEFFRILRRLIDNNIFVKNLIFKVESKEGDGSTTLTKFQNDYIVQYIKNYHLNFKYFILLLQNLIANQY